MYNVNPKEIEEKDSHWAEVMEMAKEYGFICCVNGETATLSTNRKQLETLGKEKYNAVQGQVSAEIFE